MPARMYPNNGPKLNDSQYAEPTIYYSLAKQLSDEFTIIHSLPWLNAAAKQLGKYTPPTGEIDFLVLHRSLGILAVEVKGGQRIGYDRTQFVYLNTGEKFDPVDQVRRNIHGLANWLGNADDFYYRIGYAIAFPQADFQNKKIPPALIDYSGNKPENICIDRNDINHLGERIIEIMRFWKSALHNRDLTSYDIERVIELICPVENYTPNWSTRIYDDNRTWLILTPQQTECLKGIQRVKRQVVEGRSGTGKTIIAIARARELSEEQNKRVLIVVYNSSLAEKLQKNFDEGRVRVKTFHSLCSDASKLMKRPRNSREWYKKEGPRDLHDAIHAEKMPSYDALIIDEGQVLHENWLQDISEWFNDKPIIACCDETQIFPYEEEQLTVASRISEIIGAGKPYLMTVNVRSPKAVFDRLQELQPPPYQQVSFRPLETDTLEELAVGDPESQLYGVLRQLRDEDVSPKDITVVYTDNEPPSYSEKVRVLVGEIISIYRFRGLESPIVIVLATTAIDNNTLACAYARATSRCIVLYSVFDFLIDNRGCDFTRNLLASRNAPSSLKAAEKEIGKLRITTPLMSLDLSTVKLMWSTKWGGWVISESKSSDKITASLWCSYLSLNSVFPIYYEYKNFFDTLYVDLIYPSSNLNSTPSSRLGKIDWCNNCQRWTLMEPDEQQRNLTLSKCTECKIPVNFSLKPPEAEIEKIRFFDKILASPDKYTPQEKRSMPLHLIALGRWRRLNTTKQMFISEEFSNSRGHLGKFLAHVLVCVDVISANPGDLVELSKLKIQYQKLSDSLLKQVNDTLWQKWVTGQITDLCSHKILRKRDANVSGEYLRLEIPEVDRT